MRSSQTKPPTSVRAAARSSPMKPPTSVRTVARSSQTKPPTSARAAARSSARRRPAGNRHNRPMKNHPAVVAPKDPLVDPKVLPAGPKVLPAGPKVLPAGPKVLPVGPADHLVGPADHPAKKQKRHSRTTHMRTARATGVTINPSTEVIRVSESTTTTIPERSSRYGKGRRSNL